MSNETKKDAAAEKAVQVILDYLDKGVSPWHKPWNTYGAPRNIAGRSYRGINQFLLGLAPFANPHFLTFKQAIDLGGNVKKGEKGLPVVFWKRWTPGAKDGGEGAREVAEESDAREEKPRSIWVLRYYTAFNVEQCEGLPKKKLDAIKPKEFKHRPIPEAEAIWDGYADKPALANGTAAFYEPTKDRIVVPPLTAFKKREEYYSTLFHEAGHSTGHPSRLDRKENMGAHFGTAKYGREELVAELCAGLLCNRCGIVRTLKNSAAYCKNWAGVLRDAPARAVVAAASAAQRAADYILGIVPEAEATA